MNAILNICELIGLAVFLSIDLVRYHLAASARRRFDASYQLASGHRGRMLVASCDAQVEELMVKNRIAVRRNRMKQLIHGGH